MAYSDFVGDYSLGSDSPSLSAGLGDFYDFYAIDPGPLVPDLTLSDWNDASIANPGGSQDAFGPSGFDPSLYDFGPLPQVDQPIMPDLQDAMWDTGSSEVVLGSGERMSLQDYVNAGGSLASAAGAAAGAANILGGSSGGAGTTVQPSGQTGPGGVSAGTYGPGAAGAVMGGAGAAIEAAGGVMQRQPGGGGGGDLDQFLGSNLGRILASLGIGAAGLGAAQLAAGDAPKLREQPFTPSPITQAEQNAVLAALQQGGAPQLASMIGTGLRGETTVAEQLAARAAREAGSEAFLAPGEGAVRTQALGQIPDLLRPNVSDPVLDAIRTQLLALLNDPNGGVSPGTTQRQQTEEQQIRTHLLQQLGADYELTTPGIQTLDNMRQRHNIERYTERQQMIVNMTPLEQGALAAQAQRQQTALGNSQVMEQFGIKGVPETLTGLERVAPTDVLMGGDPNQANIINTNLANQQAVAAFNADNASRQGLAHGIGGLAATIAGQVAARPSTAENLLAAKLAQSTGTLAGAAA